MSIQQDILETIGANGVEKGQLREKVGNIGQDELDCAVNALMRARRLRLTFGRYKVIDSDRALGDMRTGALPTAAEDAAASLRPAARRVREECKAEKDAGGQVTTIHVTAPVLVKPKEGTPESVQAVNGEHAAVSSPAADGVLERVTADRARALNRIAVAEVDLANLRARVAEYDGFLEMYRRFAGSGA